MAFLIYTGLRLLLLVAVIGLLHAFGMRGMLLLIAGFAISAVMSYFLLSVPREAMTQKMSGYFGRMNNRIDAATRSEDADVVTVDDPLPENSSSPNQPLQSNIPQPDDSAPDTLPNDTLPVSVKLPQQAQDSDRP